MINSPKFIVRIGIDRNDELDLKLKLKTWVYELKEFYDLVYNKNENFMKICVDQLILKFDDNNDNFSK